jgi:hypothetical protein
MKGPEGHPNRDAAHAEMNCVPFLSRTPAMAAGLADHVWTLQEWLTYPAKPC